MDELFEWVYSVNSKAIKDKSLMMLFLSPSCKITYERAASLTLDDIKGYIGRDNKINIVPKHPYLTKYGQDIDDMRKILDQATSES